MTQKQNNFVLGFKDQTVPIDMLLRRLMGRKFDFTYELASDGVTLTVNDQKLEISSRCYDPIRIETRGSGEKKKEYIVLVVEDTDDLLISVANWRKPLYFDYSEEATGKILITNAAGDKYTIQIHGNFAVNIPS